MTPPLREKFQAELHLITGSEHGLQTAVAAYINHNQATISRWLSASAEAQHAQIFNTMQFLWGVHQFQPNGPDIEAQIWQLMSATRGGWQKPQTGATDETINNQLSDQIETGAAFIQEMVTSSIDGYTKEELATAIHKLDAHVAQCETLRLKMDARRMELARIEARNARNFEDKTDAVLSMNRCKAAKQNQA